MTQSRKMVVVTDTEGRVIAAGHRGESSVKGLNIAIKPLPGQTVHEVDIPELVTRLPGRDFHLLLSQASFDFGAAKLTFPNIRLERRHKE